MPTQDTQANAPRVEAMTLDDLPAVMEIDNQSFPRPWPEASWRYEITGNRTARCYVARSPAPQQRTLMQRLLGVQTPRTTLVTGIVCMWIVVDEAHIATIAAHASHRRRGIGRMLLRHCIAVAREEGCATVMLEVRVSNRVAQTLYTDHGFAVTGERKHYYSDNNEDALIMTLRLTPPL